jgi:hypothetical protein
VFEFQSGQGPRQEFDEWQLIAADWLFPPFCRHCRLPYYNHRLSTTKGTSDGVLCYIQLKEFETASLLAYGSWGLGQGKAKKMVWIKLEFPFREWQVR